MSRFTSHVATELLLDLKDCSAAQRPAWSCLIVLERRIGWTRWRKALQEVIRTYARQHNVPATGVDP